VSAETLLSDDVARVLLSGTDVAPPLFALSRRVPHLQSRLVTTPLPAVPPPAAPPDAVRALVFDSNGFTYFHRTLTMSP
jgi:hypothetical protein